MDKVITLSPHNVSPSPFEQFRNWLKEAVDAGVPEPRDMCVSTASPAGIPSSRFVILKALDSRGFIFCTSYASRKSQELVENPHAALVFFWREVNRSVRVVGTVERVSREESKVHFENRPVDVRLGAWASRQSTVVGEEEVQKRLEEAHERFGEEVPLPDFWGGWRVVPT